MLLILIIFSFINHNIWFLVLDIVEFTAVVVCMFAICNSQLYFGYTRFVCLWSSKSLSESIFKDCHSIVNRKDSYDVRLNPFGDDDISPDDEESTESNPQLPPAASDDSSALSGNASVPAATTTDTAAASHAPLPASRTTETTAY